MNLCDFSKFLRSLKYFFWVINFQIVMNQKLLSYYYLNLWGNNLLWINFFKFIYYELKLLNYNELNIMNNKFLNK